MEDEVEAEDNEDETTTFFKRGASFKPLPVKVCAILSHILVSSGSVKY